MKLIRKMLRTFGSDGLPTPFPRNSTEQDNAACFTFLFAFELSGLLAILTVVFLGFPQALQASF
jgi:hypothetical protein